MTLHDVRRLVEYANTNPPLRVLVMGCATALGVKFSDPSKPSKYLTAEEFRRVVQATGGKVPGMSGAPNG